MHCRSCEILIEEKLKEIPEIKNAQVSYKKSEAVIYSNAQLDLGTVKTAIKEAGYEVGADDFKSWVSQNIDEYIELAKAAVLLFFLYLIAKKFGIFNISTGGSNNPSSLLIVLLIGLTAGISTCMALVGGLILGISARHSEKHPESTPTQKFRPHLYFNLGRIASYFILGGLIGLIGKAFQLSGTTLGLLTIIVGGVMLFMGVQLTSIFPRLSNGRLTLPSSISKFFGIKKHNNKEYSHANSMLVGALTFFLPCGFTQAMQLYAMSTGSFWSGALIMGTFAAGTAPGLLGIGGLTSVLKGAFAKRFYKFTGLLVIALAIFNISNGFNLTGWKVSLSGNNSSAQVADDPNVKLENGIQIINMDQLGGGYRPNKFTIKKDIPVKWVINAKNTDACSGSIMASKIGVKKILEPGINIIEFTPKETGEIKFSCLMGMYTGKFIVVEGGISTIKDDANKTPQISSTDGSNSNNNNNNNTNEAPKPSSSSVPTPSKTPAPAPTQIQSQPNDIQVIKATYSEKSWEAETDITPSEFTVSADKPVRFEIAANADGVGCMGSITIPGLTKETDFFEKGKTTVFEFTPTTKGTYDITCAMGVPRGTIIVI